MLRGCKSTVGCAVSLGEKSSPRVGTSSFMKKIQSNQPHPSPKYTLKWMQWGCWVLEGSSGPAPSSEKSSHKEGIHRVTEMTLIFKTFNQLLHYKRTQVRTSPKDCNEPSGAAGDGFFPEVCHLATRCIEGGGGSHETLAKSSARAKVDYSETTLTHLDAFYSGYSTFWRTSGSSIIIVRLRLQ